MLPISGGDAVNGEHIQGHDKCGGLVLYDFQD